MRKTTFRLVTAILCLMLALSLTGCRKPGFKGVTAAADPSVKGSVTVYTSLPSKQADAYLKIFRAQYPNVDVTVVNGSPAQVADKLIKEKKDPKADVVWHTPLSSLMRAIEASAAAPYAYHPGQIDALGGDFVDGITPSNPLWVGTNANLIAFAVNTGASSGSAPKDFTELADPKYKGKIVLPSVKTPAGWALVSALMVSEGEEAVWGRLAELDKNVSHYTDSDAAAIQDVQDGKADVAVVFDGPISAARDAGDVDIVFPGVPELSPYDIEADALVRKASPSKVAKVFLDWAISDPAMAAYAKATPITAVDQGGGLPSGYPQTFTDQMLQPSDFKWSAENQARVTAEWMKRFGKKVQSASNQ